MSKIGHHDRKRSLRRLVATAVLLGGLALGASAGQAAIVIRARAVPRIVVVPAPRPARAVFVTTRAQHRVRRVWIPGHWTIRPGCGRVWVPGHWRRV